MVTFSYPYRRDPVTGLTSAVDANTDFPFDGIEALIDKHGLAYVLRAIEVVCFEKAEHVAVNWQDARLAKRWSAIAQVIGRSAARAETASL